MLCELFDKLDQSQHSEGGGRKARGSRPVLPSQLVLQRLARATWDRLSKIKLKKKETKIL